MSQYIILSLKHTSPKDKHITVWKAGDRGYTTSKKDAGLYAADLVEKEKEFYNNDDFTLAVEEDAIEGMWIHHADPHQGKVFQGLPNTLQTWKELREIAGV